MTIEQLRIFVAVATTLNMTRGAQALGLTQSAASAAIAALEARYATRLFDRVGRRVELTKAGQLFLDEAQAVLLRATIAEQVFDDLAGLARGTLHIHASQTIADYWLPPFMHRSRQLHPGIVLALTIGNTAQVTRAVIDGRADFGFIEGEIDEPNLSLRTVARDELMLVVGPQHAWAGLDKIEPAQLTETAWVMREKGSGTRSAFEAALPGLGVDVAKLDVALELPSNESVRAAVEAGAGATVTSHLVVDLGLRAKTLHHVALTLPQRPFYLLQHSDRYRSHAHGAFLRLVDSAAKP